ncbi:MAG TPA: hypothetical protein VJ715_01835 [Pyrinomonadaceae bacterium]|nr:hypothetical protein [Pyrinomonadaceae bacterium]
MTVCPCCGFKFEGDLQRDGCAACGARAVGPALSRPVRELPSYGRSLFVGVMGGVMLATFLVSTLVALFERGSASFGFWSIMGAAETAAWRLKWVAIPATIFALWTGVLVCRSIRRNPHRFLWARVARGGLWSALTVAVLIATLIGITVPERLRQRELRQEASIYAQGYTIQRALLDYRARYGTLPAALDELRRLPDADNSIATALVGIESNAYSPGAELAALPKKKSRSLRGSALRNVSLRSTDDAPEGGLSFTRYELRLPGPDNKLGTEDDWAMRDGVITKPIEPDKQQAARPSAP